MKLNGKKLTEEQIFNAKIITRFQPCRDSCVYYYDGLQIYHNLDEIKEDYILLPEECHPQGSRTLLGLITYQSEPFEVKIFAINYGFAISNSHNFKSYKTFKMATVSFKNRMPLISEAAPTGGIEIIHESPRLDYRSAGAEYYQCLSNTSIIGLQNSGYDKIHLDEDLYCLEEDTKYKITELATKILLKDNNPKLLLAGGNISSISTIQSQNRSLELYDVPLYLRVFVYVPNDYITPLGENLLEDNFDTKLFEKDCFEEGAGKDDARAVTVLSYNNKKLYRYTYFVVGDEKNHEIFCFMKELLNKSDFSRKQCFVWGIESHDYRTRYSGASSQSRMSILNSHPSYLSINGYLANNIANKRKSDDINADFYFLNNQKVTMTELILGMKLCPIEKNSSDEMLRNRALDGINSAADLKVFRKVVKEPFLEILAKGGYYIQAAQIVNYYNEKHNHSWYAKEIVDYASAAKKLYSQQEKINPEGTTLYEVLGVSKRVVSLLKVNGLNPLDFDFKRFKHYFGKDVEECSNELLQDLLTIWVSNYRLSQLTHGADGLFPVAKINIWAHQLVQMIKKIKEAKLNLYSYGDYIADLNRCYNYIGEIDKKSFPVSFNVNKTRSWPDVIDPTTQEVLSRKEIDMVTYYHLVLQKFITVKQKELDECKHKMLEENFLKNNKDEKKFVNVTKQYAIIPLKTLYSPEGETEDNSFSVQGEGRYMHHCLYNSYSESLSEGKYKAYALRAVNDLGHPLVTIGVTENGIIDQTYRQCDKPISQVEADVILEWIKSLKGKITLGSQPGGWYYKK